jgi:hypothetical protein
MIATLSPRISQPLAARYSLSRDTQKLSLLICYKCANNGVLQSPPMPIDDIIRQLEDERNRIERAIQVLSGIRSGTISNRAATRARSPGLLRKLAKTTGRRTMSAAARRRIAAAQRARWARVKEQQAIPIKAGKRRISAAGRARIAAAARARWAKVRAAKK